MSTVALGDELLPDHVQAGLGAAGLQALEGAVEVGGGRDEVGVAALGRPFGVGAQLIVVDNSPPSSVEDDIVSPFTRNPDVPPYGLNTEATS